MKKRILNLMLAAVMLCAFIPCAAHAEEQYGNYTYEINSDGKGVTITYFDDSEATSFVIPDTIAGLPVTQIGDAAFMRHHNLRNIIIPDSVTVIGENAFQGSSLRDISMSRNITVIGDYAFFGCYSLTDILIPDSATAIGKGAFQGCSSLQTVTIGKGVKTIGDEAFHNCHNLWDVYYTGTADEWQVIDIGKGNDILNEVDFYYGGAAPVKAVAVTVTKDGETYRVAANTKYGGKAYAAVYADGQLLRTASAPFIGGSASISPDTTGGDTVKFFVWSNYFQPLTQTEIQTVGE